MPSYGFNNKSSYSLPEASANMLKLAAVLACLLCLARSLLHARAVHTQTASELQAYLNQLVSIENAFKSQIEALDGFVGTVNKNATALEGFTNLQAGALENGIQEERKKIYEANDKLVLPVEKRAWDCQLLNQTQVDQISKQISGTQANIDTLQHRVQAEPDCQRNNELEIQISSLNLYINRLVKQLSGNCAKADVPPPAPKNVYVVNSRNQFYTFGSQGQAQYTSKINSLLAQGYVKIECPSQSPYPKNSSCVACPQDKVHYYDLTNEVCLTCPDKYEFQVSNHTCNQKPMNSNPGAPNYVGPLPTPIGGAETCPIQTPFARGSQCVGCPKNSFYDFANNTCHSCPDGTAFDANTRLCIYTKFNSNPGEGANNYCCGPIPSDAGLQTCPKQSPYFNGKQCVTCRLPAYFSIQTLTCLLCPEEQRFSTRKQQCMDKKYLEPKYNSSVGGDTSNYFGTPQQPGPDYEVVVPCPKQTPFLAGSQCIECALPRYFNFEAGKCEICPAENRFDVGSRKCVKLSTQQMNTNMTTLNNYNGKIPDFNSSLSTCPGQRPFFDGSTCISCELPKYVDFSQLACRDCQQGYVFTLQSRQCLVTVAASYTDLSARNIFYNGNFSALSQQQQQARKSNPKAQQCSQQTPYFNRQDNTCIKCPMEFPLFDYKYSRCIACGGRSEFNEESHICIEQGQVSASIERMMMNTIGWI